MILFDKWTIQAQRGVIARQYDNLTQRLEVLGDLPEGWIWEMLVQADGQLDILSLSPCEGGIGIDLTAEMLALAGYYTMQLRGTQENKVRHTNRVTVYIPESLSGDASWPVVPSEFSQAEDRIRELNAHPPIPGGNGYWMLWDLEQGQYVESDLPLPAVGGGGYKIGDGLKLDPKSNTLSVDTVDAVLEDNTKPVTSGAVYMQLGNVEALLKTI